MGRFSKILMIFALVLITGCNGKVKAPVYNDSNPKAEAAYEQKGRAVYSPVNISDAIDNPIEIEEISTTGRFDSNDIYNYLQINGLLDQEVEKKINTAIKDMYEKLLPYANGELVLPYHGSRASTEGRNIKSSRLIITAHFNCNNILSIVGNTRLLYDSFNDYRQFNLMETLNLDLNTGEEIYLPDIFTNGTDALEIVNNAINTEINGGIYQAEGSWLSLTAPFKGIKWHQKFYLTHNGINIVIDHNNPEFNITRGGTTVELPYGNNKGRIAITERFYDGDASIYINDVANKRFLLSYGQRQKQETNSYELEGGYRFVSISYPEDLPQVLVDKVYLMRDSLSKIFDVKDGGQPKNIEELVYCERIGPYINFNGNVFFAAGSQYRRFQMNQVFREDGSQLTLEALFTEGFNYKDLLKEKIILHGRFNRFQSLEDVDVLLEEISFRLGDTAIYFTTGLQQGNSTELDWIEFGLLYSEIGSENLTIFEE